MALPRHIALNSSSLKQMILIVFSISAGVAPVYILRWFWHRINAWSQISVMLCSCLCTLGFHYLHLSFPSAIQTSYFNEFSFQIILGTFITTIVWVAVTFLTPRDEISKLTAFAAILPDKSVVLKRFSLAFIIGVVLLGLNLLAVYLLMS